jgi:hypothetical protein
VHFHHAEGVVGLFSLARQGGFKVFVHNGGGAAVKL